MEKKLSEKLESQDLEKVAGGQKSPSELSGQDTPSEVLVPDKEIINKLKCSKCGYRETRRHPIWECYKNVYYFQCPKCFQQAGTPNTYLGIEQD